MKKSALLLSLLLGLFVSVNVVAQATITEAKMSVTDRMAKARAAKAEKKSDLPALKPGPNGGQSQKATAADYQTPVDKTLKGPNGELVHTGERGGKFYINKNGNKTYLSSNQ